MTATDMIADTDSTTSGTPTLLGVAGLMKGVRFPLEDGNEIIIGRSRSCDISLRKLDGYKNMSTEEREKDQDFNTVSRSHVRIQVITPNTVRCEDISTNGTYCNDELLKDPIDIELSQYSDENGESNGESNDNSNTVIRLGARESFILVLMNDSDTQTPSDNAHLESSVDDPAEATYAANNTDMGALDKKEDLSDDLDDTAQVSS